MAVHVQNHDLVCTFSCYVHSITPTVATLRTNTVNYSEPVISQRDNVTSLISIYSESTDTISVFARNHGELRILSVRFSGIQIQQPMCSEFNVSNRLLCHLASSGAEVAFFSTHFPPWPLVVTVNFFRARENSGRERFIKITLVDSRLHILDPSNGQLTHPSPVRFALCNGSHNPHIAAGIMFVYVSIDNDDEGILRSEYETVETRRESYNVPTPLVANLQAMYPHYLQDMYPQGRYPGHMVQLMNYLDMERSGQIEGCEDGYFELLELQNLDRIMDVLMAGIGILDDSLLTRIYRLIGRKLDMFGSESIVNSAARLGFRLN